MQQEGARESLKLEEIHYDPRDYFADYTVQLSVFSSILTYSIDLTMAFTHYIENSD